MDIKKDTEGYVYILEVKDIDLPVCKIGMTSRNPYDRCAEINNSSTGDFIWELAHMVAVDDCKKLEFLVHKKLEPLRQKRREFFNINADTAYNALQSIMESQSEIVKITIEQTKSAIHVNPKTNKKKPKNKVTFRKVDSEYAELLQSFTSLFQIKGRPFGQLNKPLFGISDGNEGIQWNIAIWPDIKKIRLGINLEGMEYSNWPITNFILSELENPKIIDLKAKLEHPESMFVRFMRDAWQVTSRPEIVEKYFGGREFSISEIDPNFWSTVLKEALGCLNENRGYRGRAKQTVTLAKKPAKGDQVKSMWVSPHLAITVPIELLGDIKANLEKGVSQLKPLYEWVDKSSK